MINKFVFYLTSVNIFGLYFLFYFSYNTNLSEPAIDDLVSMGSQFSKSPDERENMLRARKQAMILKARQRYMVKGVGSTKTD